MNRTDLLNHLVIKHNLKRYLEIGVQVPELNFDKIKCEYKKGVDPDPNAHASFCMTSDDFFETGFDMSYVNTDRETKFDLIFIDGLHTAEQVKKDFENALKILSPDGFIVLHDVNPETYERTLIPRPTKTGTWNGDCYKFASQIVTNKYTVDVDHGCMVIPYPKELRLLISPYQYDWVVFSQNRQQLLNLISWDEFIKL